MKLIVGLGNPGKKYERTRHNLGFIVMDKLVWDLNSEFKTESKFKSDISIIEVNGEKIIVVKPLTFMNNSGQAVSIISKYFNIPSSDIWVVHDDVDFPLGALKIKFGGASAGHNGVESIIESLGTDEFWRFRMGLGHPETGSVEDYVLEEFRPEEKDLVQKIIKRGIEAIKTGLDEGVTVTMNRFNMK